MPPDPLTLDGFIDNDQCNLDQIRRLLPHFRDLMPPIHELYDTSRSLIPRNCLLVFDRCLLLCHKSFLAAAVTVARRHPDDAAAITRRAIEAASLALAVKHDPENLKRWKAYEQRLERWRARREGEKPKPLRTEIQFPRGHQALEAIRRYLGVLSDVFVHFTPEFVEGHTWRHEIRGEHGYIELPYLEVNQRVIERELLILGGIHVRILDLFDECYDRVFSESETWREKRAEVGARGVALGRVFAEPPAAGPTEENDEE